MIFFVFLYFKNFYMRVFSVCIHINVHVYTFVFFSLITLSPPPSSFQLQYPKYFSGSNTRGIWGPQKKLNLFGFLMSPIQHVKFDEQGIICNIYRYFIVFSSLQVFSYQFQLEFFFFFNWSLSDNKFPQIFKDSSQYPS